MLIADDDGGTRAALAHLLSSEGYHVVEAADGEAVLGLLAAAADSGTKRPDVLLLDFVMPGYSGLGILRVLRRFGPLPPTIVMTGFPDPSLESLARGMGATGVIRKPVDAEEMLARVRQAAALAESPGRSQASADEGTEDPCARAPDGDAAPRGRPDGK